MNNHTVVVVLRDWPYSSYYGSCRCGWDGPPREDRSRARRDGIDHVADVKQLGEAA